jgi:peptidylprolyl isomerase
VTNSATAKSGDTVKVEYTGKLTDGSVFDSSLGREPLGFTLGKGQMIQGFEKAVFGMKVGQSKTVTIPSAEAYGPYYDDRVLVVNKNQIPQGMSPRVDDKLLLSQPNGQEVQVTVTAVTESTITLDANHFLASKDLVFEIKLLEIVKK